MTTINELLYDSITMQGEFVVTRWDDEHEDDVVVFNGCGDELAYCEDDGWMDEHINFIYPDFTDANRPRVHIELNFY